MRISSFFSCIILSASLYMLSCDSKGKKENAQNTVPSTGDNIPALPDIDTAALKDEVSILDAMQKVVDARISDEKRRRKEPAYEGYYLELTTLYTTVISASTAYSKTLTDPAKAVEFGNKLSAIQDKMYAK